MNMMMENFNKEFSEELCESDSATLILYKVINKRFLEKLEKTHLIQRLFPNSSLSALNQ